MSRRRHQKGHVEPRGDIYRGWYRQYPEGKQVVVELGKVGEISKRQAQQKLQEIIRKMEEEAPYVVPQSQNRNGAMTVKQYVEEHYMKEFWPNLKPGTKRSYKQVINARVIPELGSLELSKVGRRDIQLLINRLRVQKLARHTLDNVRNVCGS
jgi:cell division protein FtsI/penicillin-binding protein 2